LTVETKLSLTGTELHRGGHMQLAPAEGLIPPLLGFLVPSSSAEPSTEKLASQNGRKAPGRCPPWSPCIQLDACHAAHRLIGCPDCVGEVTKIDDRREIAVAFG
jgi:hypothetical protein